MYGATERFDRRLLAGLLCVCATVGGLAGAAAGQSGQERDRDARVQRIVTIQKEKDGRTYSVHLENGELSAEVDGEPVPEDRIRRDGGRVEILGDDGEPLASFIVDQRPRGRGAGLFTVRPGVADGEFDVRFNVESGPAPKVMVGITMSEPGEVLRQHLRLEPGQSTMVDRVIEGLPADEAGLEAGDIIVEIDGQKPGSAERLREVLADREPGDELELTVIHRGERRKVTLKLEAYDAERLRTAPDVQAWAYGEDAQRLAEEARRLAEARVREFRSLAPPRAPAAPDTPMVITPRGFYRFDGVGGEARQQELDERLEALGERLSDLDRKLKRIEEALDRLGERGAD